MNNSFLEGVIHAQGSAPLRVLEKRRLPELCRTNSRADVKIVGMLVLNSIDSHLYFLGRCE